MPTSPPPRRPPTAPPPPPPRPRMPSDDKTLAKARTALSLPSPRRPTVALAVTGSVAAYKAAEIARLLVKAGVRVIPLMTRSAEEFIGAVTLSGLTGEPVRRTMWDPTFSGELHVSLAREIDALLIAPATADVLARLASGRADDLVTALALVCDKPLLVAPAMHPSMWAHPATRRNVATMTADGRVEWLGPIDGPVASGEEGVGRMQSPEVIAETTLWALTPRDLSGLRLVVTAGPTIEDLDPVRFLSNRSSGQMGFAVARRAAARGADVTLIAGPVQLATPPRVRRVDVRSAVAMRGALWQALGPDLSHADALVMSAAVSDHRPATPHATKQKKRPGAAPPPIELADNPDLLAEIGHARASSRPVLVGFAVETDSDDALLAYARGKLISKRVDLVVANNAADSFGRGDNRAFFVSAEGHDAQGTLTKEELADRVLDRARDLWARGALGPPRMLDLPVVAVVLVSVAGVLGYACTTPMMGSPVALWLVLGLYAVLGGLAIARMWRDGTLLDLFRWRSGDIALGFATALALVAGAYGVRRLLVPPGTPSDALIVRVYAQLGELPRERGAYALATLLVTLTALLEELTWRGLVQQVLEERLGHKRGWLAASGLYALAHAPTVVLLAMPGVGYNPLVVMAALGCGVVWGFWVGRLQRLAPSLVSHALFTWVMVMQLRLLDWLICKKCGAQRQDTSISQAPSPRVRQRCSVCSTTVAPDSSIERVAHPSTERQCERCGVANSRILSRAAFGPSSAGSSRPES